MKTELLDINDVVKLLLDLPEYNLSWGAVGTIVVVFDNPTPAYEVEFLTEDGRPLAQIVLLPQQLRKYGD